MYQRVRLQSDCDSDRDGLRRQGGPALLRRREQLSIAISSHPARIRDLGIGLHCARLIHWADLPWLARVIQPIQIENIDRRDFGSAACEHMEDMCSVEADTGGLFD